MKKILIFSLFYYPHSVGGAEIAIKEITDRISDKEIEFDMITLRNGATRFERIGNVNVYRVGYRIPIFLSKLLYPFLALFEALRLHKKNKYDLIWSMMASYAGFAGFFFKKYKTNILFILSLQEGENFERRQGIFKPFFKMVFSNANYIQVISKFLENWAIEMDAKCPIQIIPNGVDFDFFSNKKSYIDLELLKQKLGKKSDDIFLITTSRLVEKNAVGDIIDSLVYLPLNVKLLILGQGHLEEKLREKVHKLDLKTRVSFLGYIPHSEMPQYLHISDIFIRPALSEGFGNSYIEAMAAGIPVIATPVGGIVDFLRDHETGLFSDVENPKSIAEKVEELLKDKGLKDYVVKNALEMVKEKYQWNLIANDMKNKVFLS